MCDMVHEREENIIKTTAKTDLLANYLEGYKQPLNIKLNSY